VVSSKELQLVGVVYAFSEANHAVFQNAGCWKLKRDLNIDTWAYAPREYLQLYYSANCRIQIPPPYHSSTEIQRYFLKPVSKKQIKTWFTREGFYAFKGMLLDLLSARIFHSLPASFVHDYKSKRYLFESGLYKFCKSHFEQNAKETTLFLGTTLYTNPGNLDKFRRNLTQHFEISFQNLQEQIEDGSFSNFRVDFEALSNDEKSLIESLTAFIGSRKDVIFLRSRNLTNDIASNNGKSEELRPLILELLSKGVSIIHSGTPPVNLEITDKNYFELSHSFDVATELALARQCTSIMQSSYGGLFTAVTTVPTNLIIFDEEWSLSNLARPISLMSARKKAGCIDLKLGNLTPEKANPNCIRILGFMAELSR